MSSGVRVVPTTEAHLRSLHEALDIVARERLYLAFTAAPPWEQSQAFYRDLLAQGLPHVVAVAADGLVLGWCDIAPLMGESRAHIGTVGMGLRPEARGQGLGRALLQAALARAWDCGFTRIELTVREDNHRARTLYESLGFAHEGVRRRGSCIDGIYHDVHAMALLR